MLTQDHVVSFNVPAPAAGATTTYATVFNALCLEIIRGDYTNIIADTDDFDVYFDGFTHDAGTPGTAVDLSAVLNFDDAVANNNNFNFVMGFRSKASTC